MAKDIYKNAFMAEGFPLNNKRGDILYWEENLNSVWANVGLRRTFYDRFLDIKEMEGRLTAFSIITSIEDRDGKKKGLERNIFRVDVEETPEEYFEVLKQIKEKMIKTGGKSLAMYPPYGDRQADDIRKMVEVIFRGTDIKSIIYTKNQEGNSKQPAWKGRTQKDTRKNTEVLLIKSEGRTYTELLKSVRERVKANSMTAKGIRIIREAKDGRMAIVMEKEEAEANSELAKELKNEENMEIVKRSGDINVTLNIRDLESVTTREEVRAAVCKEVCLDATNQSCVISSLITIEYRSHGGMGQ